MTDADFRQRLSGAAGREEGRQPPSQGDRSRRLPRRSEAALPTHCRPLCASFQGSPWIGVTRAMGPSPNIARRTGRCFFMASSSQRKSKGRPGIFAVVGIPHLPNKAWTATSRRRGQGAGSVPHSEGDRLRQRGFRVTGYRQPGQQLAPDGDAGPRRCPMAPCGKKVL
jgi:hypothetical protein